MKLNRLGLAALLGWIFFSFIHGASAQYVFTAINDPLSTAGTTVSGISGNNIVGTYYDTNGLPHGFVFDGLTYSSLLGPAHVGALMVSGISGSNIIGYYTEIVGGEGSVGLDGFIYSGGNYTDLVDPLAGVQGTKAIGISGNNIVGAYTQSATAQPFLYDGSSYTDLNIPVTSFFPPIVTGISGNNISGYYVDSHGINHGFIYDGSTAIILDDPLANEAIGKGTFAMGISGSNVVGYYIDSNNQEHGFLFNGTSYQTIDDPAGFGETQIVGIDGDNLVGNVGNVGFKATLVPEPSSFCLLGLGLLILKRVPRGVRRVTANKRA